MKTQDTLLVSIDFSHGRDTGILLVGRKMPNQAIDIVNAFQGEEAETLYKKLVRANKYEYFEEKDNGKS